MTQVELVGAQQSEIHRGLLEGAFDLGLVNYLEGDDLPPGFETTEVLRGRPVVCVRPDSPLAALDAVDADSLLVVMRSGYVMHRFLHRLLSGRTPSFSYSTDGAEMGKLMVAEGLGATVLPDFSVLGDPPPAFGRGDPHSLRSRRGAITVRPLAGDATEVLLVLERRDSGSVPRAVRDLHELFVRNARACGAPSRSEGA
ncbi:LysR substrate binding domain-containing protein [Streptomyces sp. cf386]|nr:LysR substrate binding domain-containing protein [Streptomyces sp. cf386]